MRDRPAPDRVAVPFPRPSGPLPVTPTEHELAAARDALRSMEAQLVVLYEEKEQTTGRDASTVMGAMVESLAAQVCALIDEKADLERRLADATRPVHAAGQALERAAAA